MQKTAQKRSILDRLNEATNVSGIVAEKFFDPEFKKVMDSLRKKDDTIRATVAGQTVGDSSPSGEAISLKTVLKSAKSNFNRKEYIRSIADLGRFHKKIQDVISQLDQLKFDIEAVHHEFLFKKLDDDKDEEYQSYLQDLKKRFASQQELMIKEAKKRVTPGILDFLHNITTDRGRGLSIWEKRYPSKYKELKEGIEEVIVQSEHMLNSVLSSLKLMAKARSARNPDAYIKATSDITKRYIGYESAFKTNYATNFKSFIDLATKSDKSVDMPAAKVEAPNDLASQELPTESTPPSDHPTTEPFPLVKKIQQDPFKKNNPSSLSLPPTPLPVAKTDPAPSGLSMPGSNTIPNSGPPTLRDNSPIGAPGKSAPPVSGVAPQFAPGDFGTAVSPETAELYKNIKIPGQLNSPKVPTASHNSFLYSLEAMSEESPLVISLYIRKYAHKIKESDPKTAIKLFKIANSLIG